MAVIKIVPMPGAVGDKGDEGAVGPQGPQGPAGQNGLPGTPALWSYQGAYNSASAYAVGDVVVYQGQLYYTKSVTTAGTLPTNTVKFDLIASKGADGQPGTNGSDGAPGAGFGIFYLGNYNPSSGYVPDIAVVRGSDGQLYLAKASGALGDPVGNTAQWEVWIPKGADGANGTNGTNGADALWNYTGEYNGGASYAVGDIATYDGQLWYRVGANGGNVGDTPSPGFWNLLAAKGEPGTDVFAEDGTLYGPTNFGALKVLGLINSGDNDLGLYANDANIILQTADGKVDIVAPEVNIVSNVVPSSFNINTYLGASVNSNRTSTYAVEDKVVATLGDLTTPTSGTWDTKFAELSGIDVSVTNPGYEANKMGYYYCVGDLVHWEFRMLMNNPVSWGQTGIGATSFKFALPFVPYHLNENESVTLALRNAFSRTVANGWFRVVANSNPVPDPMLPPSTENLYYEADESHLIFANAIIRPQVYNSLTGGLTNFIVGQSSLTPWPEGTQLLGVAYLYANSPEGPVLTPGYEANTNTIGYQSISAQWPANLIQAQLDQNNSPDPTINQQSIQFNFSGVYRKA